MKIWFIALIGGLAGVLALSISRIPQPWQAGVIAWLLFIVPFGLLLARILRYRYAYKTAQLKAKPPPLPPRPPRAPPVDRRTLRIRRSANKTSRAVF